MNLRVYEQKDVWLLAQIAATCAAKAFVHQPQYEP